SYGRSLRAPSAVARTGARRSFGDLPCAFRVVENMDRSRSAAVTLGLARGRAPHREHRLGVLEPGRVLWMPEALIGGEEAVYRGVGAHAHRRLGIGPAEIRREECLLAEVAAQPIAACRPGQVPRERQ